MTRNPPLVRLLLCVAAATQLDAAEVKSKKLIEFGWDEPGTEFLREHIAEMEKTRCAKRDNQDLS